jgi:hypothetical protein
MRRRRVLARALSSLADLGLAFERFRGLTPKFSVGLFLVAHGSRSSVLMKVN